MLVLDSPIGRITVWADTLVRRVQIAADAGVSDQPTELEQETARQLEGYFAGSRTQFNLPLADTPAELHHRVWKLLDGIPFGTAVSYGHIARELGLEPGAARAVGGAVGANPVLVVRPCHRVLGVDGSLTGYAGGLDAKLWLLQHEGVLF